MVRRLPRNAGIYLALATASVLLVIVAAQTLPEGVDWVYVYRPATRALLSGQSPYTMERVHIVGDFYSVYYNPPWTLLPLIPLALLPAEIGRAALFLVAVAAFAYSVHRLGAGRVGMAAFLLSPPVWACVLHGNMDWMPTLGFALPPRWGLFLVFVKPQIGAGVALFWFVEAWRQGGWRAVVAMSAPLVIVTLLTVLLFGPWPLDMFNAIDAGSQTNALAWNASLWPSTLPAGVALLAASMKYRRVHYAIPIAPCLSPYVALQSWSGALAALAPVTEIMVAAVVGCWALVIVRATGGAL